METVCRSCSRPKPEFFKALIGDFKQRLRIPHAFVKHISEESSGRVILEGPNHGIWHVKLNKTMNGILFLEDGWEKFSTDSSLRLGEFLIFKYKGDIHFSVRIFGQSACCKREDSFNVKSSQESPYVQGRRKRGKPPKSSKTEKQEQEMETLCPNCLDVKPEFFKVIIGDQIMLKMRIPPAFVKHVSEKSSERVTLECPGGDIWHAKLSRRADGMFIEDGWEKFLRDQSLGDEEFLVFRYNGDLHFSVTIFDKSACWREDSFEVNNPSQVANHPGSNPSMSFETNKHGTAEKPRRNRFLGLQNPNQYDPLHSFQGTEGQRKSSPNSVKHYEIARSKEWEAAFTFKKPYFIVEMKEHCVDKPFYVTIPSSFVRSYIPYKKVKMVLQTDNNKRWPVSFSKFATRSCICGGWAKFCLDSNLRKGDYCAFELVDELELRVYISRVH